MKTKIILFTFLAIGLSACSDYDDNYILEYTPEAVDDNSWTADINPDVEEDKDVTGLLPTEPEFRNTLVSRLSAQYDGNLSVTINDYQGEPTEQHVLIRGVDADHINFGLKNFILISEDDAMPVGTIVLNNIQLKDEGDGMVSFEVEQNITIRTGDHEIMFDGELIEMEDDDWVGSMLGDIPVKISGRGNASQMIIGIDIVMESLGQVIHVDFIAK